MQLSEVFKFHNFDNLIASSKVDPRLKTQIGEESDNLTHLIYAAANNRIMDVRRMIARGVNLRTPDYDGRTALHLAASNGHYDIAKLLINFGAELNPKDRFNNTPIDDAKANGHRQIVELIEATSRTRLANCGIDAYSVKSTVQNLLISLSNDGTLKCTKTDLVRSMYDNGLLHYETLDNNSGKIHDVLKGLPNEIDEALFTFIVDKQPRIADALRGKLAIPAWLNFK